MKLPEWAWRVMLVIAFVAFIAVIGRDLTTTTKGPDYCAMANLRSCKVDAQGTWVTVTTPEGGVYILLMQNGKLAQVQKIQ